ncbi:MAG TPA: hypothetical protein DHW15_13225 [Bacteroidetes bacterium]|nr:MAG: hypothetical protein ABR94_02720 [Sphingobacteriales bacterium BACL12 MAG-120802-bin5]KRP09399.1 MAG: hypothetical protein ABR95_00235 [Sphingobacteriales bacterium BACL12 MAG-120813-bin55]HCK23072.1 hypothetical protein [Bacteroidota bacterium]
MTVKDYIRQLQAVEEYAFSIEEAIAHASKDATAVKREIARLVDKKEIVNLRKGFYLILPPRYSRAEKLPIQLYAHKLFHYLQRNYYIGLFSAAATYGASHQQLQRDYFITEAPKLNAIQKQPFDIHFFTTSCWPSNNIPNLQSDAGIYAISSPTLTFIDLIHHHPKIGGLNRMLASLEELIEAMTEQDLSALCTWYPHKSTLQRAGFLLEEFGMAHTFADIIYDKLQHSLYYPVLLSPRLHQKPGSAPNRWKIDVNLRLENDL